MKTTDLRPKAYALIRRIPYGKVATYGQIAYLLGCSPRLIGHFLATATENDELPWQRVVNTHGKISERGGEGEVLQRFLLQQEGVIFNARDKIDFNTYGSEPTSLKAG